MTAATTGYTTTITATFPTWKDEAPAFSHGGKPIVEDQGEPCGPEVAYPRRLLSDCRRSPSRAQDPGAERNPMRSRRSPPRSSLRSGPNNAAH
jgi:hypothetical protein